VESAPRQTLYCSIEARKILKRGLNAMSKMDEGKNPIFVKRHDNYTAAEYDVDESQNVVHHRRDESRDRNNCCDQQIAGESDVYRTLGENEIRILEILAGSGDEEVHCRLKYIKLDGLTEYNALSYAWGDTSKPQVDIYIDG
jgi:hypothetical protein